MKVINTLIALPFRPTRCLIGSFSIFLVIVTIANTKSAGVCGYSSCPKTKPGHINVHLVAHSHDDVGWVKTVDEYYLGTNRAKHEGAVQYILDSVVEELAKDPQRKFIQVETAFFWRWWRSQTNATKELVKKLVNDGQLEFVSGGWTMHDEGSTHYNAIIDQMSLGLRFLNDTFGACATPKATWQIDSFGHARESASLFAQMGFDGLFLGRMDYQYKSYLYRHHEMEMIWNANPSIGEEAWLFTGVLYNYYQPPDGFCFDMLCTDDPINDDPELKGYNVDQKVQSFIRAAKSWSFPYDTNNALMTMGSDFHYMNGNMWFKNLDKLIKYVNNYNYTAINSVPVNAFYSTPACYIQEVYNSKKKMSIKDSDFFPYSNDPFGFWSGYFTSRPTFKYYIHMANNFLQVCKQVAVGAYAGHASADVIEKVFQLSEPVGIMQHHDAIPGTATQVVTDDYSQRLSVGITSCERVLDEAFRKLQRLPTLTSLSEIVNPLHQMPYRFCHLRNISACAASEEMTDFIVSVYNPLARDLNNSYIRIPVTSPNWNVRSQNGDISAEVMPIAETVLEIPGRESNAKYEVVFKATLPAASLTNFRLTATTSYGNALPAKDVSVRSVPEIANQIAEDVVITNSYGVKIVLDGDTGLLKTIARGSVELPLKQNFYYYVGMAGNNSEFRWRASGAYVFRPNTSESNDHRPETPVDRVASFRIYRGIHVTEVHQVFTRWISQVIRLYDKSDLVEFEWLVGPIPVEDGYGKEIITKYSTNIATKGTFFTDSNGRQLIKRERNTRDFPFVNFEKVAGNYYPVTSRILITEAETFTTDALGLIVLNDRSQGGTSLNDGEIELMVHRRLLWDDAFGVDEALNETAYGTGLVARGRHWLLLAGEGTGIPLSSHREIAQNIFMDNILGFTEASNTAPSLPHIHQPISVNSTLALSARQTILSEFRNVLPVNIHLLTVEAVSPSQILLRLEHFYEKDEHSLYSRPVTIPVEDILKVFPLATGLRETNLGANQWAQDVKRFQWTPKKSSASGTPPVHIQQNNGIFEDIVLGPMDIKTFLVDVRASI